MNADFNIGAMGNVALNRATASKQDSIASLASGKKQNLSRKDPGAFSLSQRLQVQSVSNQGAKVAIQNAMSIAHTQEEALNRMSKLLTKMNELAGMASSTGTLSSDRDAYQAAFAGFVDDFEKIQRMIEIGDIEIAPLAFMRGRTLKNSFAILDEAQNATDTQIKMFLTRIGENSKIVVNGDPTQIDLPNKNMSGLVKSKELLGHLNEISVIDFDHSDVVRHPLVSKIVKAYSNND